MDFIVAIKVATDSEFSEFRELEFGISIRRSEGMIGRINVQQTPQHCPHRYSSKIAQSKVQFGEHLQGLCLMQRI